MVCGRMMLGPVVCVVELARAPIDVVLVLAFAIAQPMESHVNGLCAFWLDFSIHDAFCCGVVGLERGGRLRMAQPLWP